MNHKLSFLPKLIITYSFRLTSRNYSILFLLLSFSVISNAQVSFSEQNIITGYLNYPTSAFAADIDGDGDIDVVSASNGDNKISWYENIDGNGTFGKQQIISTESRSPSFIFAADIDGDGDLDVLVSYSTDDMIGWFKNEDGNGSFGSQQVISTDVDNANSLSVADIDGDGDMDVISSSSNDDKIAWFENLDGSGTFGTQQIISTIADGAFSVNASDIDGDGDIDVLSASWGDDKIAWYENTDGNGTFSQQKVISLEADLARSVYSEDIDGDGDMDVLSASWNDNKIAWYENIDGSGTFGAQKIISTSVVGGRDVYAADIDNDGDIDVLSASGNDGKIAWYENVDGNGTFDSQQVISLDVNSAVFVSTADIDSDGDLDVLSVSSPDNKIAWYENTDGNGTFGQQKLVSPRLSRPESIYLTDIDNDTDLDVLTVSHNDDKISWYENTDGNGTFGSEFVISSIGNGPKFVHSADIDNDGDMDVLSAIRNDNTIAWYENINGNGSTWIEQKISTTAQAATCAYAVDIDGDGDKDVVSSSFAYGEIAWYENTDAKGTFGPKIVLGNVSTFSTGLSNTFLPYLYVCDMEGDGDIDVLIGSKRSISWFENLDGNGTFSSIKDIRYWYNGMRDIHAEDIDNDGDMDVLAYLIDGATMSNPSKLVWLENMEGNTWFGQPRTITDYYPGTGANSNFGSIHTNDIDLDGDKDIIVPTSGGVRWFENSTTSSGSRYFISHTVAPYSTLKGSTFIYSDDIDKDGDHDILCAVSAEDKIVWYRNSVFRILSISRQLPLDEITDEDQLIFRVSFDGDVQSIEITDFEIDGTTTAVISSIVPVSGTSIYDVTISDGDLASFNGIVGLNLSLTHNIQNINGDALPTTEPDIDETYLVSNLIPTITTTQASSITVDSAESGGNVVDEGGASVFAKGVCWSINTNPTINDNISNDGLGLGTFNSSITGLLSGTTYYYRAYATNLYGTAYGEEFSFTTNCKEPTPPTSVSGEAIICPTGNTNLTIQGGELNDAIDWYWYKDNCSGTSISSGTTINVSPSETTIFFVRAEGDCVSSSNCVSFLVTVQDTEAPTFTIPESLTINTDPGNCSAIVNDIAPNELNDNCSIPTVSYTLSGATNGSGADDASGTAFNLGVTTVEYIAADANANSTTETLQITVLDQEIPVITCIENLTINLVEGQTVYTIIGDELDPLSIEDDCGVIEYVNDFNGLPSLDGAELAPGITTITWTATDNAGNIGTCNFDVTTNGNTTSIAQLEKAGISIYPNPTKGKIKIETEGKIIWKVKILNLLGKELIMNDNKQMQEYIDISSFEPGIYIFKFYVKKSIYSIKVVKE